MHGQQNVKKILTLIPYYLFFIYNQIDCHENIKKILISSLVYIFMIFSSVNIKLPVTRIKIWNPALIYSKVNVTGKYTNTWITFDLLLTVHLCIFISVINQFDAQNICFTISLFHVSTCFQHTCSSSGGQNCITQPPGIITPTSGRVVHKLRESSLNLCTRRPLVGVMIPEAV